jgi:hypothetical protein
MTDRPSPFVTIENLVLWTSHSVMTVALDDISTKAILVNNLAH